MEIRKLWSFKRHSGCLYERALQICSGNEQFVSFCKWHFQKRCRQAFYMNRFISLFAKASPHTTKEKVNPKLPPPSSESAGHTELKIRDICFSAELLYSWSDPQHDLAPSCISSQVQYVLYPHNLSGSWASLWFPWHAAMLIQWVKAEKSDYLIKTVNYNALRWVLTFWFLSAVINVKVRKYIYTILNGCNNLGKVKLKELFVKGELILTLFTHINFREILWAVLM